MYMTRRLHRAPFGDTSPVAAVGNKIYSFGWPEIHRVQPSGFRMPLQIHCLNTESLSWVHVLPTLGQVCEEPKQRYGHSAVAFGEKIYIWGGIHVEWFDYNSLKHELFGELICFDTVTSTWSIPKVSGNIPLPRYRHFAFVIGHYMYLIGGFESHLQKHSQDVFALDLHTMKWKCVAQPNDLCNCCEIFACAIGLHIYVFSGGHHHFQWNCGMYLDTETNMWHKIMTCGSCPAITKQLAFACDNSIYVFVRVSNVFTRKEINLFKLSLETKKWQEIVVYGKSEIPILSKSCVAINSRVFMFGRHCDERLSPVDVLIIDFSISLRVLCLQAVLRYDLDTDCLPTVLRAELSNICKYR